jgi:hypothetical protein
MEVKEKGRRGRPAKNSEESTENEFVSTIKDPLIEPFYIQKDKYNFTVFEVTKPTRGFAGGQVTGNNLEKFVGHYTSFTNALKSISKKKFYNNQNNYNSIKEYMNDWELLRDGIESLINKIEI